MTQDEQPRYPAYSAYLSDDPTEDELEAPVLDALAAQLSPVCTFCAHWRGVYRQCSAYPYADRPIPADIWERRVTHATPYGGERLAAASGKPIVFRLHPEVVRTPLNAALLHRLTGDGEEGEEGEEGEDGEEG